MLALPLDRVRSDLQTLAVLLYSRTFRAVRADEDAWQLVSASLTVWAERLQEEEAELADLDVEEVLKLRAGDENPFPDAADFFGADWQGWRPEPRLLTAEWLQTTMPEVLRWLGRADDGWGFDYEPSPWIAPEDAERLCELLQQRGYAVVFIADLAAGYDDPPRNVDAWLNDILRRAASTQPISTGGDS